VVDEEFLSNIAINICLTLFSLRQKAQRKKLGKKEMPFLRALPEPATFFGKKGRSKNLKGASRGGGRKLKIAPPKTKIGAHKKPAVTLVRQAACINPREYSRHR
jgi:hypothetical protein